MTKLLQYLESIHPLTDGLRDELHRIVTAAKIKKKGYLLKSGRVCSNIYFIEEGLLRGFYIKNQLGHPLYSDHMVAFRGDGTAPSWPRAKRRVNLAAECM